MNKNNAEVMQNTREFLRGNWKKAITLESTSISLKVGGNLILLILDVLTLVELFNFVLNGDDSAYFKYIILILLVLGAVSLISIFNILNEFLIVPNVKLILFEWFDTKQPPEKIFQTIFKKDISSNVMIVIISNLFISLWTMLLIVPGIIKAIEYAPIIFIWNKDDNKKLGYFECMRKSSQFMRGHRWRYFCLQLHFIGWWALAIPTLGIALIWVIPYHQTANVAFFHDLWDKQGEPS